MALDPDALMAHDFGQLRQSYSQRDAILYALGVGLGHDPLDPVDLRFLDERNLSVLPSFAVTLASPGMWIRDPRYGVDFARLVHAAQSAEFFGPLPPNGEVIGTAQVASLRDRGPGRGAELVVERHISDAASGALLCHLSQTLLLRGDGGFGGEPAQRQSSIIPQRSPDLTADITLSPRAALIYRLSGDWNPLHLDPVIAQQAGFPRPIMQGLGLYGAAGFALCRALAVNPTQLRHLSCRFSGVVMPGSTICLSIWQDDGGGLFTATAGDRLVLDQGRFGIAEALHPRDKVKVQSA